MFYRTCLQFKGNFVNHYLCAIKNSIQWSATIVAWFSWKKWNSDTFMRDGGDSLS